MKLKLSSPESPMLVYYWAKLTGMAPFTLIENKFHPPSITSRFHTITFVGACCLFQTLASIRRISFYDAGTNISLLMRNWNLLENLFGCATVTSTLLIFLIRHKEIVRLMNKLGSINDELKSLDIVESGGNFFKYVFVTVVATNVGLAVAYITMGCIESNWVLIAFIKYDFDTWSIFNMVLSFAGIMLYVRQRFGLLNQKLFQTFGADSQENSRGTNPTGDKCLTEVQRIRKIELLHLELCDLIDRITQLYNIPIMFNIIQCFALLTASSFWIFFVINNSSQPRDSFAEMVSFVVDNILFALLRMSIVITQSFIIAHAAVRTCEQGNATRAVLSKVWDYLRPRKIKNEFLMFSTQLLHTPVLVSLFGFFNLGYSVIFEIFCSVAAYSIITIQLDSHRTQQGI